MAKNPRSAAELFEPSKNVFHHDINGAPHVTLISEPNLQKHQSGGWLYYAFSTGNPWPFADRGLLRPRRGAFAKFDIDLMQIACFICAALEVKALRSDNDIIPSDDNQHWKHIYTFTHKRDG